MNELSPLTKSQTQIMRLQAQVDTLLVEKQARAKDKLEMQARINHLLAELKLSQSQQYGKKSEKTPCGGEPMHTCVSEDSEQIKILPAKISIIKRKQFKYVCKSCEHEKLSSKIMTAPKPAQPILSSIASPAAIAAVVTAKYCDALPLYQLVNIFERGCLRLSRSTLANGCIHAGDIIQPLVEVMRHHLLKEHSLCADETDVQVLDEGKSPSSKLYTWVYRSHETSQQPVVIYDYQAGRSRAWPKAFLADYQVYLQCNGCSVNDGIADITAVGCWPHARRKYNDALKPSP